MYIFSPRLRLVSMFVIAYFVAGLAAALMMGNREFLYYEIEMAVILAIIVWMDKRVTFSRGVVWCLAIWGMLHLAGGLLPIPESISDHGEGKSLVLYNLRLAPWLPRYDQIIHAFGFGTSAVAAREALSAHFGRRLPISAPIAATLFFIACGLGALNELIEFSAVELIPETNVGGYFNTGWDLVSNATGATLAIILMKVRS